MKSAIVKEHRDFFHKQGWIEFEQLLLDDQIVLLNQAIRRGLSERLRTTPERMPLLLPDALFLGGRDLWRSNSALSRYTVQPRLAQIASELLEKKPLRLGYDQFLPPCRQRPLGEPLQDAYSCFVRQTADLNSVSCLRGIACGLFLALDKPSSPHQERAAIGTSPNLFPTAAGNGIFFRSDLPVPWEQLLARNSQSFYLIVYTENSSYYYPQPGDPHAHALKRLGYVYNDRLNDKLHPIVYR